METAVRGGRRTAFFHICLTAVTALLVALGMHVFIYPSDFAPSGVDGIATMLQRISGVNAGVFIFIINVPLIIAAYFVLRRRYVLYTLLYTVLLSGALYLLAALEFYQYAPQGEALLPALFGGAAQGLTGMMLRIGASSGGIDILASMVQKRSPHREVERIISLIEIGIVFFSYLVYRDLESILLSIVEIYVCERVTAAILHGSRSSLKLEVVSENMTSLRRELLAVLGGEAVLLSGRTLAEGEKRQLLVCLVDRRRIAEFFRVIDRHPDAVVYYAEVRGGKGHA